jgi:hypothetical protein
MWYVDEPPPPITPLPRPPSQRDEVTEEMLSDLVSEYGTRAAFKGVDLHDVNAKGYGHWCDGRTRRRSEDISEDRGEDRSEDRSEDRKMRHIDTIQQCEALVHM